MDINDDWKEAQDKITYILCHTKSKKTLQIQWRYKLVQENSLFCFFFFCHMTKCIGLCKQHKVSKRKKT